MSDVKYAPLFIAADNRMAAVADQPGVVIGRAQALRRASAIITTYNSRMWYIETLFTVGFASVYEGTYQAYTWLPFLPYPFSRLANFIVLTIAAGILWPVTSFGRSKWPRSVVPLFALYLAASLALNVFEPLHKFRTHSAAFMCTLTGAGVRISPISMWRSMIRKYASVVFALTAVAAACISLATDDRDITWLRSAVVFVAAVHVAYVTGSVARGDCLTLTAIAIRCTVFVCFINDFGPFTFVAITWCASGALFAGLFQLLRNNNNQQPHQGGGGATSLALVVTAAAVGLGLLAVTTRHDDTASWSVMLGALLFAIIVMAAVSSGRFQYVVHNVVRVYGDIVAGRDAHVVVVGGGGASHATRDNVVDDDDDDKHNDARSPRGRPVSPSPPPPPAAAGH